MPGALLGIEGAHSQLAELPCQQKSAGNLLVETRPS